jgi:hypothetical protein
MAVDEREDLTFSLRQKPNLVWPFIRSAAHLQALAPLPLASHAARRAVPSHCSVETDGASTGT